MLLSLQLFQFVQFPMAACGGDGGVGEGCNLDQITKMEVSRHETFSLCVSFIYRNNVFIVGAQVSSARSERKSLF